MDWSLRELGRTLGMCVEGCPELQEKVLVGLQDRSQEVRAERASQAPAVVVEAVLAAIHDGASEVQVDRICRDANHIFALRGERTALKERKVGGALKLLGLRTKRLGSSGRGLGLSRAVQQKVHELARTYGTRTPLDFPGCEFCLPLGGRPN